MKNNKETIRFIRACLKDEGFSKELIAFLFSTYDLETFLNHSALNKLELATHFLNHARHIHINSSNY